MGVLSDFRQERRRTSEGFAILLTMKRKVYA